jgi:hypothetical protein
MPHDPDSAYVFSLKRHAECSMCWQSISEDGVKMRDYFAAHCPDSWLKESMPKTIGAIRDAMIARRIIPADRRNGDVLRSYDDGDEAALRVALRWEYADMMMKARAA